MKSTKEYMKVCLENIRKNSLFIFSALAAGLLMFFSVTDYWDFVLFFLLMCGVATFFSFDRQMVRENISVYKLLASLALTAYIGSIFFDTTVNSYKLRSIASSTGLNLQLFSLGVTAVIAMAAFYYVCAVVCFLAPKTNWRKLYEEIRKGILQYQNIQKAFAALLVIYLLAISAILRADINYLDDMRRIANGFPGWEDCSRYLSNILSQLIGTNSYMADISPLTQIIAVFFLAIASLIVIMTFAKEKRISAWNVIAVLPLGISPYFLECLSYKFDSPYMALAVLAGTVPLLFIIVNGKDNFRIYLLTVILCTLVTCTTYQAALGIFPLLIIFTVFERWLQGEDRRDTCRLLAVSVAGYVIGGVIYASFIMTPIETYAGSSILSLRDLPTGVISNLKHYYSNVLSDFDTKWLIFIGIIMLSFVMQSALNSCQKKWLSVLVSVLTVAGSLCLAFGPYAALESALFQCRAMFGFGSCVAMLGVICVSSAHAKPAKLGCFCLSWCFFVFGFVYGNALEEQQRYVDFRTEMVISDLNGLIGGEEVIDLQITGTVGDSPILENMPQYEGVLGRLIQTTFSGDSWVFDTYYFVYYYDLNNANGSNHFNIVTDLEDQELPVLFDGYYETIYGDETRILVELKEY
ncbi:MAG: glucosyltransferase domain-containing protein [Lachnospiraceae bacterium]|nr:glucosyltransferase domain-containing protein [Lachnospiraceae bacterium]